MFGSLGPSEWIVLAVAALLVGGAGLVAAIRALWIYRAPKWLRWALLFLLGVGIVTGALGSFLGSESLVLVGFGAAIVPFGTWLVARSIFHRGPPPGLLEGPKGLDKADDVLDSVGGMVGLEPNEYSDEDDA